MSARAAAKAPTSCFAAEPTNKAFMTYTVVQWFCDEIVPPALRIFLCVWRNSAATLHNIRIFKKK